MLIFNLVELHLLYNIRVFNSLEQRYFSDGCAWYTVIFFLEFNLFEGYDLKNHKNMQFSIMFNFQYQGGSHIKETKTYLSGLAILSLVDDTVSTLS